ncbi:MAG: glycosyltransferase family 9 protein [Candidatus Eisenbacteria bacterium]
MSPPAPPPHGQRGFREIAVIRLSSLGDVVLTLPVVHALSRTFPEARITYWVKQEFADVVRHDPCVGHVRELERDARRLEDLVSMSAELEGCDLIVDLHDSLRSRVLTLRQKGRVLRVKNQRLLRSRWVHARWSGPPRAPHALERYALTVAPAGVRAEGVPRMVLSAEHEEWAAEWRETTLGAAPILGFCPAARHATKRWPEEHWLALHGSAVAAGFAVTAFSLPRERQQFPKLAAALAAGKGAWCVEPLARQAALLGGLRAVVTGDTGLMHVAAARGARVVALFGSTSPVLGFSPAGEGHTVLCRNEPCQPCTLHGREVCPKGHFRCMRELRPDEVFAAVQRVAASDADGPGGATVAERPAAP